MTYNEMYDDEVALQWASITKLTRNLFLAAAIPVLVYRNAIAEVAAKGTTSAAAAGMNVSGLARNLYKHTPGFIYGFIGMSALRSIGDATAKSSGSAFGLIAKEEWKAATSGVRLVVEMVVARLPTTFADFRALLLLWLMLAFEPFKHAQPQTTDAHHPTTHHLTIPP